MSRTSKNISDTISIHYGHDHAIGHFLDITDTRYANSSHDEQGEGYVFEHSVLFPTPNNKAVIYMDLPLTEEVMIAACDKFINSLNIKDEEE